jgi:hypothetical protein
MKSQTDFRLYLFTSWIICLPIHTRAEFLPRAMFQFEGIGRRRHPKLNSVALVRESTHTDWLIDGGKVISPTHQPHFTPPESFFFFLKFLVLISVRG